MNEKSIHSPYLPSLGIYNGVDEGLARHLDRGHLGGEGAAPLKGQDEHLSIDPVESGDIHLRHRQPYPQCPEGEY